MNTKNSHSVSRFLTRPWEIDSGILHYYDFKLGRLRRWPSKSFLVSEAPYGDDVEQFLSRIIESPLAKNLKPVAISGTLPDKENRPDLTDQEKTATVFSILLQAPRMGAARGDKESLRELKDASKRSAEQWDRLGEAALKMGMALLAGRVPEGQWLFFPESGIAPIPFPGGTFGLFQPTSPKTFNALVPAEAPKELLRDYNTEGRLIALSVGLKGNRVIVPPGLADRENKAIIDDIKDLRRCARSFCAQWLA